MLKQINFQKHKYMYLLISPALLLTFVFSYLPMAGIIIAFQDFDILTGFFGSPWVGFENFRTIFSYPAMLKAIGNTLIYSSALLASGFVVPIIMALLFNEIRNIKFKKVVQTVSYMPYFLSWISIVGIFYGFFANEGTLRDILNTIAPNFQYKNILLDSKNFLPILVVSHIWKNAGWSSVIYLAAIAGIDPTLYEAATVDGCNKLKQVWHITLQGIKPTAIIVLIMSIGGLITSNFDQVYGFQNVYTQENTEVINTLIYRQGIQDGNYSLATAFGLAQGLVSLLLVMASNYLSKKSSGLSIW